MIDNHIIPLDRWLRTTRCPCGQRRGRPSQSSEARRLPCTPTLLSTEQALHLRYITRLTFICMLLYSFSTTGLCSQPRSWHMGGALCRRCDNYLGSGRWRCFSKVRCLSAASSDFWKTLLADFQRLRSQPPTKPRSQTAHALPASAYPPHPLRIPSTSALALPTPILYNHLIQHPTPFCDPKLRFCCITQETRRPT